MLSSVMSNPIMKQMDRIVQSVNNKAQKDVQHIRQARKDTVVLSAKALFIAEENKKTAQAEQKQAAESTLAAPSDGKGRSYRELCGYRSEYEGMHWRSFELKDAKQYAREAKNYLELASQEDINEDQRQQYLKSADFIKSFCIERVMESGNRILKYAENYSIRAEKLGRESIFDGVTGESLGLFDLEDKSLDEIMQAIDNVLPVVNKIAEKINNTNQIEYNEKLEKYRPEYHPASPKYIETMLGNYFLGEEFSTMVSYSETNFNLDKAIQFDSDDIEHVESNVISEREIAYEEAMENRRYAAEFYKTHNPPV